jgi:hypothetical protein
VTRRVTLTQKSCGAVSLTSSNAQVCEFTVGSHRGNEHCPHRREDPVLGWLHGDSHRFSCLGVVTRV